jgi:hypothetical protein
MLRPDLLQSRANLLEAPIHSRIYATNIRSENRPLDFGIFGVAFADTVEIAPPSPPVDFAAPSAGFGGLPVAFEPSVNLDVPPLASAFGAPFDPFGVPPVTWGWPWE